jgi:7-cyano-7-deazaguanine synthase
MQNSPFNPEGLVRDGKKVIIVSGGMDSITLLRHMAFTELNGADNILALSFNYGSRHNNKEIPFAAMHCLDLGIQHQIVDMDFIGKTFRSNLLQGQGDIPNGHYAEQTMKATVVPFRNGIMLSVAAGYAESVEANAVYLGAHAGDHTIYPDCRPEFQRAMSEATRLGTYAGVEVVAPYVQIDKAQIVRIGNKLGVDYTYTWSCYKGGDVHCGVCSTCFERREAFKLAEVVDPTEYLDNETWYAAPK